MKLIYVFIFLNILLFYLMGLDKSKAKKRKWRIRESYLICLGVAGGCIGGLLGMQFFRHKTKKSYFYLAYLVSLFVYLIVFIKLY